MTGVIRRVVRGAYRVPIVGYLLGVLVGILTLPWTRDRVRAIAKGATDQRRALRNVKRALAEASTRAEMQQAVDRAVEANDTAVALRRLLPAFMNAIGSVKALTFHVAKTDAAVLTLDGKVEAALRRLDDATASLLSGSVIPSEPAPVTKILAPEKLSDRPLKLNLGCGHAPLAGHVNVDVRRLPGVDIVSPFDQIPLAPNSVDEILSAHLLERFELQTLERFLLPSWVKLLKVGGRFSAIALDVDAMMRSHAEGGHSFEEFRDVLFGTREHEGGPHLNILTPESLAELMRASGLIETTVIAAGRRNGNRFEFEITGIRA